MGVPIPHPVLHGNPPALGIISTGLPPSVPSQTKGCAPYRSGAGFPSLRCPTPAPDPGSGHIHNGSHIRPATPPGSHFQRNHTPIQSGLRFGWFRLHTKPLPPVGAGYTRKSLFFH